MSTPTPTPAPPDVALDSPARAASFRTTASGTGSTRTLSGLRSRLSSKLKGHRHTESAPAGWAPSSDDSTAFDPASEPAQGGAADIQDSAARGRPGHARNFSSASAASVGQAPPVVARAAHAVAQLAGMNPITAQRQLIVGTLVATALAAQLLSRLLHWSVGLMAIGVGAHLLLSKLDIAARDSAWERETATREVSRQTCQVLHTLSLCSRNLTTPRAPSGSTTCWALCGRSSRRTTLCRSSTCWRMP
jgi:hypothetical protein